MNTFLFSASSFLRLCGRCRIEMPHWGSWGATEVGSCPLPLLARTVHIHWVCHPLSTRKWQIRLLQIWHQRGPCFDCCCFLYHIPLHPIVLVDHIWWHDVWYMVETDCHQHYWAYTILITTSNNSFFCCYFSLIARHNRMLSVDQGLTLSSVRMDAERKDMEFRSDSIKLLNIDDDDDDDDVSQRQSQPNSPSPTSWFA